MNTLNKKSCEEIAKAAGKRLVKIFGGRSEVNWYDKFAEVIFTPRSRCNYTDLVHEAQLQVSENDKRFQSVIIGDSFVCQYFD